MVWTIGIMPINADIIPCAADNARELKKTEQRDVVYGKKKRKAFNHPPLGSQNANQ
jgi:hypothetical protein